MGWVLYVRFGAFHTLPLMHTITPREGLSIPAFQRRNLSHWHKATQPGAEEQEFEPRSQVRKWGSATGPLVYSHTTEGSATLGFLFPNPSFLHCDHLISLAEDYQSTCRMKLWVSMTLALSRRAGLKPRMEQVFRCYCLPGHFQLAHKVCFCSFFSRPCLCSFPPSPSILFLACSFSLFFTV